MSKLIRAIKRNILLYLLGKRFKLSLDVKDNPNHIKIEKIDYIVGFAAELIKPGTIGKLVTEGIFTSDQKEFYLYVDQISKTFLRKILLHSVTAILIIQHKDSSADVYINNIPIIFLARSKRNIEVNETAMLKDIFDISETKFPGIDFKKSDNVILCLKIFWKFGLIFNFNQAIKGNTFDKNIFSKNVASLIQYLSFQKELEILRNSAQFNELFEDGWFPFIQLIGGDYAQIADLYGAKMDDDEFLKSFLDNFEDRRIKSFTKYWWSNKYILAKKALIEAGIEAYLQNTKNGYIYCIKTLYSEIEGILRQSYFEEKHRDPKFNDIIDYLAEKASKSFSSPETMALPQLFSKYLKDIFFRNFDFARNDIELSRHSTSHGVASPEKYTRIKALQAILILDQLYFYMGNK